MWIWFAICNAISSGFTILLGLYTLGNETESGTSSAEILSLKDEACFPPVFLVT